MKAIIIIFSTVFAFLLEGIFLRIVQLNGIEMEFPLVFLTLFYWFWRIQAHERIFLALITAIFLESVSLFPPGSYAVILCILALFIGFLKSYVANDKTIWVQGVAAGIFLFAAALFIPLYAFFVLKLSAEGESAVLELYLFSFFTWAMLWVFVFSCGLAFFDRYGSSFQKKAKYKKFS